MKIRLLTLCGCEQFIERELENSKFIEISIVRPVYPILNIDPTSLITSLIRRFEYVGNDYLFNGERRSVYMEVI